METVQLKSLWNTSTCGPRKTWTSPNWPSGWEPRQDQGNCFFLKIVWGHKSFVAPLVSRFRLLVISAFTVCMLCHLHAIDTLDLPLVQHLLTSWWPTFSLCTCSLASLSGTLTLVTASFRPNIGKWRLPLWGLQRKVLHVWRLLHLTFSLMFPN